MNPLSKPPCVIDNGTGYTKMGYAGNYAPNFIIPSYMQLAVEKSGVKKDPVGDLDFFIGPDADQKRVGYGVEYPVRDGIVQNWDSMEKYWQRCIYQYMSCDPEEHYFLLTEPPLNTPENREFTAEIMFETFNVPALYIAVQAVLALCASMLTKGGAGAKSSVTGTVIDSGDGVTHIIPVVEGYVIGSCIKHIPLAGRKVTDFIMEMMRARGEPVPPDDALSVAKRVKESYCYVCPDLVKEYLKYDTDPTRFRVYKGVEQKTGRPYSADVGYERFLGPEVFFTPEIFDPNFTTSLPTLVDQTIQACPIDTRRSLYNYITLSGGSTMYKNFPQRLQRDVNRLCEARHAETLKRYPGANAKEVKAKVVSHAFQRFAVWFGGSMLASLPDFLSYFHTKKDYEEQGPRIARHNQIFQSVS